MAVIESGLAAGGAILGGIASSAFNAWQAGKNRSFQERMANTAHQREVEDLRRAGLNPILSARLGGSATPAGAQAQASVPEGAVTTALQAATMRNNLKLQEAQILDINSAAKQKQAETDDILLTRSQRIGLMISQAYQALQAGNLTGNQREKVIDEIVLLKSQKKLIDAQAASSAAQAFKDKVTKKPYEYGSKVIDWLEEKTNTQPLKRFDNAVKKTYDYLKSDPLKGYINRMRKGGKK